MSQLKTINKALVLCALVMLSSCSSGLVFENPWIKYDYTGDKAPSIVGDFLDFTVDNRSRVRISAGFHQDDGVTTNVIRVHFRTTKENEAWLENATIKVESTNTGIIPEVELPDSNFYEKFPSRYFGMGLKSDSEKIMDKIKGDTIKLTINSEVMIFVSPK